ncbi:hypothetical protein [uncultured Sphingomonas sp.]|uniref:hypothetical protein n=1 Tax=uncultured Sphingomonas sp. TaxID=158754 RepID=UPI00261D0456|nr:hypothetical protein [uncultured Sphingomonas sp.]
MSLTLETSLNGIAHALETRIAPVLDDPFACEAARLAVILTRISALAVNDAAAIRAEENAWLRTLFAEATASVDDDLAIQLREAAASVDPSIRISDLDRENARLRRVLIALHGAVEARRDHAAKVIDGRIWQLLSDIEAARAPGI